MSQVRLVRKNRPSVCEDPADLHGLSSWKRSGESRRRNGQHDHARRKAIRRKGSAKFRVPSESGELTALRRDEAGTETAPASLRGADMETRLTLLSETETVRPDELVSVRLRDTDSWARESPEFAAGFMFQSPAVSCPPSAMFPYNERGYLTDTTDTCCGEALAVTCPKGNARITAQSPLWKEYADGALRQAEMNGSRFGF